MDQKIKIMTIRDRLTRKRRRLFLLLISVILCFFGGAHLTEGSGWSIILSILGFIFIFPIFLVMRFAIRCPNCHGNLGYTIAWPPTWDCSVSQEVRCCPFCGISMDKDIQEISSSHQVQPIAGKPGSG
jgi:hypothetical protein